MGNWASQMMTDTRIDLTAANSDRVNIWFALFHETVNKKNRKSCSTRNTEHNYEY